MEQDENRCILRDVGSTELYMTNRWNMGTQERPLLRILSCSLEDFLEWMFKEQGIKIKLTCLEYDPIHASSWT